MYFMIGYFGGAFYNSTMTLPFIFTAQNPVTIKLISISVYHASYEQFSMPNLL